MPVDVDPEGCYPAVEAEIGPKDVEGAELFQFVVVPPKALARRDGPQWGRPSLIVRSFSMEVVGDALEGLLTHCHRETWEEVAQELNEELLWEFDHYQG